CSSLWPRSIQQGNLFRSKCAIRFVGFAAVRFSVMPIREALIAVVALVMMAPSAIAENANNLKYALECGAAKTTPPDDDSDPIYKTKIAVTDKVIYVVHYAASGETYIRNEQYRDL